MNPLSSLRALPALPENPLLRSDAARSATSIRPAELQGLPGAGGVTSVARTGGDDGSFSGLLGRMVSEVNARQGAAGQAVADLQAGKPVSLHQAMISMEEASVSFQLMAEVRNKLLESYQELMRMQV